MRFRVLIAAAAILVCGTASAGLDIAQLTYDKVTVSEVMAPHQPGKSFLAGTLMAAPVPKLCAIIQDYAAYPAFMPNVGKAQVLQSGADFAVVEMTLDLPLGKTKKYRIRLEPKADTHGCRLSWKLVPTEGLDPSDTIADTVGYWQLSPLPADPTRSVVEYFVYADPGHVPFGLGWIVDIMSKRSLPKTLEAVRLRATQ